LVESSSLSALTHFGIYNLALSLIFPRSNLPKGGLLG